MHNKLKNGTEVEESQSSEPITLNSAERTALVWNIYHPIFCEIYQKFKEHLKLTYAFDISPFLVKAKNFPGSLAKKALAVGEALEGKVSDWLCAMRIFFSHS